MKRGTDFLGCEVAIMGGAMSWISERNLVSAISNAGGFGVIACGAMTPELLDTEIAETKARTDKPFGVNLITMHPQLSELIDVCARTASATSCSPAACRRRARSTGSRARRQADLLRARARARQEADPLGRRRAGDRGHGGGRPYRPGLDLGAGAGDPAAVAADIPVFVAGGIGRGEAIAGYLEMGAAACSSAPASSARPNASPIPTSRRPSSAPRRATRSRASRSTRACR
jgi:enoyl-[acyl-carrier protein] reductase II